MANIFDLLSTDSGTSLLEKIESHGYDIDAIRLSLKRGNYKLQHKIHGKIDFSLVTNINH